MEISPTFIIFSGHNDRAVIALARFFSRYNINWAVVSKGQKDLLHKTIYADKVIFNRVSPVVDIELFSVLRASVSGPIVICPTTEYINNFLLSNRTAIEGLGDINVCLPDEGLYQRLSNKFTSFSTLDGIRGLCNPSVLHEVSPESVPCVLKPKNNVSGGKVLYPKICFSSDDLQTAIRDIKRSGGIEAWFAQRYIVGQSFYLCGYISKDRTFTYYWQENLSQQVGGKSIVLARHCSFNGVDEASIFHRLIELGYFGPIMIEIIQDRERCNYFIEVNPRFWGPLCLSLDVCPELLEMYAMDHGAMVDTERRSRRMDNGECWYAWGFGYMSTDTAVYPAAHRYSEGFLKEVCMKRDIYRSSDTLALHLNF